MGARIRGLDGLRGIAAIAVVLQHSFIARTRLGNIAVDLFFVLSGFLIIGILHDLRHRIETGEIGKWPALLGFWKNRALRIFPLYYSALAVVVFYMAITGLGGNISDLPWYVTYTQNIPIIISGGGWATFVHTWSLSVENQFYVLFAVLLLAVPSRHHIATLLAILGVSALGFSVMVFAKAGDFTIAVAPTTAFTFMSAGGLIAIGPLSPVWGKPWLGAIWLIIIAAIIGDGLFQWTTPPWISYAASFPALVGTIAYILASQNSRVTKWLETTPLLWLGSISYGVYVIHFMLANMIGPWLTSHGVPSFGSTTPLPLWAKFFNTGWLLALTLLAATLSRRYLEQPFLRLKRHRETNKSQGGSS